MAPNVSHRQPGPFAGMTDEQLEAIAFHTIPMPILAGLCNPFSCWMEQSSPITTKDVRACIRAGKAALCNTPTWSQIAFGQVSTTPEENRLLHIQKIAYFALNPATDPIDIEVGCQSLGCLAPSHLVSDGNHRLAGAMVRGDAFVRARISGGTQDAMQMGLWNPNPAFIELDRRWDARQARGPRPR